MDEAASSDESHLKNLNDDAVTEILLRLPSVSVLRCGAVCKAWRAITSNPFFLAAHSRSRPTEMIMQRYLDAGSMIDTMIPSLIISDDDDADERRRCLDPGWYWMTLPCALYLHKPSGQHRILFLTNDQLDDDGSSASHYVRSLEDAETWRLGSSAKAIQILDPVFIGDDLDDYRGRFTLWLQHPEAKDTNKILAFDTVSETFRRMSRPPPLTTMDGNQQLFMFLSLLEVDGMVAMMANLRGIMDLWVLQDYDDDQSWTRRLRVQLTPTLMHARWAMNAGDVQGHILLGDYHNTSLGFYHLTRNRVSKQIPLTAWVTHGFRDSLQRHAFFDVVPN
ncbi:hypothetical protein QOZ80_5AG0361210 [Eleusine coracana subsp. coracana]|nr:hypothetical protein QOZ80_5AG0361210 [Eleusine coracana subsp. coracana]